MASKAPLVNYSGVTTEMASSDAIPVANLPENVAAPTHAATSKSIPVDNDELPVVDSAASNVLKKLTWSNLKATLKTYFDTLYTSNSLTLMTVKATTSGTSIDFTGIPAGVKRITIGLIGVSTSGMSAIVLQLGKSGGVETSGYLGAGVSTTASAVATANYTANFGVCSITAATALWDGLIILTLMDATNNIWGCYSNLSRSDTTASAVASGTKALAGTLDRIRLTTAGGANTFDAGSMNVMYE